MKQSADIRTLDCHSFIHSLFHFFTHSFLGTVSGFKGYIVVGTTNCYGEECTSRGRILILDLVDVVPEPGQPLTKTKVKTIYDKEQKGPVTAMAQVRP